MFENSKVQTTSPGVGVIKRSACLGTKISFLVLAPIFGLICIGLTGLLVYKSATLGMSPFELLRVLNSMPQGDGTRLAPFLRAMLAALTLLVAGVGLSAATGAMIGAAAAGVAKWRERNRQD